MKFIKGWLRDTLHTAPIRNLAILRLDGDIYESTMDALKALYAKVSPGGFVIVDDFNDFELCRRATLEFRQQQSPPNGGNSTGAERPRSFQFQSTHVDRNGQGLAKNHQIICR